MKNLIIGFIFCSAYLLQSCNKEKKEYWTIAEVSFTDRISGETVPITQAKVLEFDAKKDVHTELDLTNEDMNTYSFGFYANQKSHFTYTLQSSYNEDAYYGINYSSTEDLEKNTDNIFNYEVVPLGDLTINVSNTNCFDFDDKLYLYKEHLEVPEFDPSTPSVYNGCYTGEEQSGKSPMGTYALEWHVIKNNITEVFQDTIYLGQGETIVYDLNY